MVFTQWLSVISVCAFKGSTTGVRSPGSCSLWPLLLSVAPSVLGIQKKIPHFWVIFSATLFSVLPPSVVWILTSSRLTLREPYSQPVSCSYSSCQQLSVAVFNCAWTSICLSYLASFWSAYINSFPVYFPTVSDMFSQAYLCAALSFSQPEREDCKIFKARKITNVIPGNQKTGLLSLTAFFTFLSSACSPRSCPSPRRNPRKPGPGSPSWDAGGPGELCFPLALLEILSLLPDFGLSLCLFPSMTCNRVWTLPLPSFLSSASLPQAAKEWIPSVLMIPIVYIRELSLCLLGRQWESQGQTT